MVVEVTRRLHLSFRKPERGSEIASIETDIKKLKSNIETHLAKALEAGQLGS